MLRHSLFQCSQVIGLHMDKTGGQRLEQLMVVILTGCGQGGQGSAVEAVFQGDDGIMICTLFLRRVLSCHFDGAFVGFRTGIGEK